MSGAKWEDIDFDEKKFTPRRSIVKQHVGPVKTEKSKNPIPLDDDLIEELLAWRRETPYAEDSDYIFASPKMKGKQPYWMSRIMQHHIKPAAAEAGIEIKGWHTLRHSYTTLLRQNNGDPKVVQGLLRHHSIKVTMDIYDEAMSDEKQMAHRKVAPSGHSQTRPYRNAYRVGNWELAKLLIHLASPTGFEPVLPP